MNAILESPVLEALAFNYSSFGITNIVWTWVAVVTTAAVSFWRIKSSSSTLAPPKPTLVTSSSSSLSSQVERLVLSKESTSSKPTSTTMSIDASFLVKEEGTKGKLTVYFNKYDHEECNNDEQSGDQEDNDVVELSKEWFENWEKLLKLRKGEREWYCYQDMKVIDGSIVRLWDGPREAEKTAFSVSVNW